LKSAIFGRGSPPLYTLAVIEYKNKEMGWDTARIIRLYPYIDLDKFDIGRFCNHRASTSTGLHLALCTIFDSWK